MVDKLIPITVEYAPLTYRRLDNVFGSIRRVRRWGGRDGNTETESIELSYHDACKMREILDAIIVSNLTPGGTFALIKAPEKAASREAEV